MEEKRTLLLVGTTVIALILAVLLLQGNQKPLTVEEVVENPGKYKNSEVSVRGEVSVGRLKCTTEVCIEKECCNTCSGNPVLGQGGKELPLTGTYNGTELTCSGNECRVDCGPLARNQSYVVKGTIIKEDGPVLRMTSFREIS